MNIQCEVFFQLQNLENKKMHRFGKVLTLTIPKISLIIIILNYIYLQNVPQRLDWIGLVKNDQLSGEVLRTKYIDL